MNSRLISLIPCITLLLAIASTAAAEGSYQYELLAAKIKADDAVNESDTSILAAQIFFDEVQVGNHPYDEAAFLEKKNNLVIVYKKADFTSPAYGVDIKNTLLLGTYIDPESLLILQALYIDISEDFKDGLSGTGGGDSFGLGVGTYLNAYSEVFFSYQTTDDKIELTSQSIDAKTTDISIEYKSVMEYLDKTAINTEFSITSSRSEINSLPETNIIIDVSGDYYFNQATSLGGGVEINSGDDAGDEGKTIGLRATYYLTPYFSIHGEIGRFSADNQSGDDADTKTIGASARF